MWQTEVEPQDGTSGVVGGVVSVKVVSYGGVYLGVC